MEACLHQQRPRPALLLSTYGQLQAEVAAGILGHFDHPHPCTWSGSHYGLPNMARDVVLPERVRCALILAGCGFPAQQVPADLRRALLGSTGTPSDLRSALQQAAAREQAGISGSTGSNVSNGKQERLGCASSMHWRGIEGDVFTSCKAWAQAFEILCHVSVNLQLPLAMHPALPVPQQQSFLDYVDQLGCQQLSDIVGRHRQYLRQVVQQWPLLGTQGCIAAKDYQPKQWAMKQRLPATALTVDCSARGSNRDQKPLKGLMVDIAGTVARLEGSLCQALEQRWKELPWLCQDGAAGLVLAGGVMGVAMAMATAMAKLGSYAGDYSYDLYIIAPDQASYVQVVDNTRAVLGNMQQILNPDIPATATYNAEPIPNVWVWQIRAGAKHIVQFRLNRWPYCSPAALVRSWDVPSEAACFDGEEVFLDERCAWCHANRLLLADPYFDTMSVDNSSSSSWPRFSNRLLIAASCLSGYKVLIPGPLSSDDLNHIVDGVAAVLQGIQLTGEGSSSPEAQKIAHGLAALLKEGTAGIARWALFMASYQAFGFVPTGKPCEDTAAPSRCAPSTQDITLEQQYSVPIAELAEARQMGWPFVGFSQLPQNGDDGAAFSDAKTWFNGDDLQELPRRVWLAVNRFVEL